MSRYAVGIDIGTTSISGAVIDLDARSQTEFYCVPNGTDLSFECDDIHEQDPDLIFEKVQGILESITEKYAGIVSIGVTGQMHGILYIDDNGDAVSHLITWQDGRGDRLCGFCTTYVGEIQKLTGERVATGFGLVSHYYNVEHGLVYPDAVSICSIMDYVTMKLCGADRPLMHSSVAASLGLFDVSACKFKLDALDILGIDRAILPEVTDDYAVCGEWHGIPVSVGIGDNQASFLGTVRDVDSTVLVNIGTGSQVSAVCDDGTVCDRDTEVRPLVKGKNIICGSALCGGASYALLEKFFREFSIASGQVDVPVYDVINRLAEESYRRLEEPLNVSTLFRGKRSEPSATGSISGITAANFTPGRFALGFIFGICQELYEYIGDELIGKTSVVASGNAVQKIGIMREVIEEVFGLPVSISDGKEEASVGTALFSTIAANELDEINDFADFISYK